MDKQVLNEKIESIRRCISRIEDKMPDTVETLLNDLDIQDIISLNLSRSIQLAVDIAAIIVSESEAQPPATMAESFEILNKLGVISEQTAHRMKMSVGFRNIAIHSYKAIDWHIVYNICHKNLGDFQQYIKEISKQL